MSKQTITIQNPCSISIENHQLVIEQNKTEASIPLEDIYVLILETKMATVTSYALSEVVKEGIGVMICDGKHHPNGLLLPLGAHSRHAAIVKHQLAISAPLRKRLWQKIVQQKISNQAKCLELLSLANSNNIKNLVKDVQSGDKTNKEAHAAQIYFKNYLPSGTRTDSPYTAALNYGYTVLRAGIARSAVSYGWLVSRGIHHDNDLNPFNLVDDLIEPFRPVVDLMIGTKRPPETLTPEYKRYLVTVFEYCVLIDGKEYIVQNAIDEMMKSLKRAIVNNNYELLQLPEVIQLKTKRCE